MKFVGDARFVRRSKNVPPIRDFVIPSDPIAPYFSEVLKQNSALEVRTLCLEMLNRLPHSRPILVTRLSM